MHSREECTVPLNNGCFTPVVFSAYGALPVDGSVWSSFADVEGVTSVGHQLRVPSYGSFQDKMVSRLDWVQTSEQTYQPNILLSSTNLFIGGWWRVRWWQDRSLVMSSLVASPAVKWAPFNSFELLGFLFLCSDWPPWLLNFAWAFAHSLQMNSS